MSPVGLTPRIWIVAAGAMPRRFPRWTLGCGVRLRAGVLPEEVQPVLRGREVKFTSASHRSMERNWPGVGVLCGWGSACEIKL